MAWLEGWNNRIPIVIDHSLVSNDIPNYFLILRLSASEGSEGADVTTILSEVKNKPQRIAVTSSDEVTELVVKVGPWYYDSLRGTIGITIPLLSSSVDTTLYLYFDYQHADNTTYVSVANPSLVFNTSISPYISYGNFESVKYNYRIVMGAWHLGFSDSPVNFETTPIQFINCKTFLSATDRGVIESLGMNLIVVSPVPSYKFYYFQNTRSAISKVL